MKAKLIITLIRVLALFSLKTLQRLGAFAGALAWRLDRPAAQVTRINLQRCFPELTEEERERLGAASLRETGKTGLEMAMAWGWAPEKALATIRSVRNEELVEAARADGRGLVFLAPHLGNWELVGLYLSSRFRMAALYEPPKLAGLEPFMKAVRGRIGSELVPTTNRGVLRLLQILRDGDVVGILPDQEPALSGGEFAPFFGVQANSIKLVSKLIEKTGARVLCIYAKRLPAGEGFEMVLREADPDIYSTDLATSVAALNRSVEACVREVPEQYQWEYKRFKRRPEGEARWYPRRRR